MPEGGFPYHGALDGLRALALVAIVAYHLHYGWATGAFLSVDLFFLLSGFLITTLLIVEWRRTGTVGLRRFWSRRARRLLPALLLTIVVVAVYTRLEIEPWNRRSVRDDALASLFYVANWRFIAAEQGYFQVFSAPSPLRHMWTLAIEEQFYLVWPLVTSVAFKLGRGTLRGLVVLCGLGVAASVAVMAATYVPGDPLRAYYGTDSRVQVILLGALLAVLLSVWTPGEAARARLRWAGPAALVAMLVAWGVADGEAAPYYRGGSVLHGLVACVVLTAALHPGVVRAALGIGPLAWVGRLSYGLYLFHWPIIVWVVPNRVGFDGVGLDAFRIALTVLAAVTSYYLLELPVRERRLPTPLVWGRHRLAAARASAAAATADARAPRIAPWAAAPAVVLTLLAVLASAGGAGPAPDFLVGDAPTDEQLQAIGDDEEFHLGDPMFCGEPAPEARAEADLALAAGGPVSIPEAAGLQVMVVGDSTACSLYPGVRVVGDAVGAGVDLSVVIGCGVASGETTTTRGEMVTPNSHRCPDMVSFGLDSTLARFTPDVVVWMSIWEKSDLVVEGRTVVAGTDGGEAVIQQRMDDALARFTAVGARVVLVTVAAAAPNDAQGTTNTSNAVDDASYVRLDGILHRFAARHPDDVTLVDLASQVCPGGPPCPADVGGVRMRPDGRHFTPTAAVSLARWLFPQLAAAAPRSFTTGD